jgi:hypothetical protein
LRNFESRPYRTRRVIFVCSRPANDPCKAQDPDCVTGDGTAGGPAADPALTGGRLSLPYWTGSGQLALDVDQRQHALPLVLQQRDRYRS